MSRGPLELLSAAASGWGAPLDARALERMRSYLEDVRERNARVNLTADADWDDLVLKHAADGVFAAAALRARAPGRAPRLLDLGAGAGFIGIALKLAWPEAEVTLMESVERKFRFLNWEAARLALPGLRVLRRRAGTAAASSRYETDFDLVVERALAPLPEAALLAAPRLKAGGIFAAFQSRAPDAEDAELAAALRKTRSRLLETLTYRRPGESRERRLVLISAEPAA